MFTKRNITIFVAAFVLVAVTLACLGQTPSQVMDDARTTATMQAAETQAYILINGGTATQGPGPTNTLASGQVVQTNIAADFAAQTGMPMFTSTATLPAPTKTKLNTAVPTNTLASAPSGNPPPASCKEQMLGPWQPPSEHEYWYVQVNTEFVDSDYLVSLWYENEDVDLSGWLISNGTGDPKGTEIVYTVRTSIEEVQFANPTGGVGWRLCAHPDAQLAKEARNHANNIAADRTWLRVYDVGDLWMSLQSGDAELIKLIKCITPSIQGIPSCQTP